MTSIFYPKKSPVTQKYGISNNEDQLIIDFKFDIILEIIANRYAIVGNKSTRIDRGDVTKMYLYGIIDLCESGKFLIDIEYEILYLVDDHIIIQLREYEIGFRTKRIINEKTLLGQYVWKNALGCRYLDYPILASSEHYAVIAKNISQFHYQYILIDKLGNTIEDCHVMAKDWLEWESDTQKRYKIEKLINKVIYNTSILEKASDGQDYVRLDDCDYTVVDVKWESYKNKINRDWASQTENLVTVLDSNEQLHKGYIYHIFSNLFFCVGYKKPINWRDQKYNLILDSNRNVILESKSELNIKRSWPDRLLINDTFLLDSKGVIYQFPIINKDWSADYCNTGYGIIYSKGLFGVMDKNGKLLTPIIFPPSIFERDLSQYFEDLKKMSSSDAYEGDYDALWNTD